MIIICKHPSKFPKMQIQNNPPSPSFYRTIYSQVEEVGWQHLLRSSVDLSSLTFRIPDESGRLHVLDVTLPRNFPQCPPSLAADVPYLCELEWSKDLKLKHAVQQFSKHLHKLQEFWCTLEEIDRTLFVVDPKQPSLATSYRQISLGIDCYLLLSINPCKPRSLPECRWFGPDSSIDFIRKCWKKNSRKWMNDKPFRENLLTLLEIELPRSPIIGSKDNEQVDCGICYSHHLPVDDELGAYSGGIPEYTCDNSSCMKAFHVVCLRDWLRSISTTRQSFDVLFGNCPYCSGPVAVKMNNCK